MDHYSPFAPAHVRVLVLPVGQIEQRSFTNVVSSLQKHCSVLPLKNLASSIGDRDFLLSPTKCPEGYLLYDFTARRIQQQQQQQHASPFEQWREPLLVLGVLSSSPDDSPPASIKNALEELRERHGRVVHRHVLYLHTDEDFKHESSLNSTPINTASLDDPDTPLNAIKDVSIRFLEELSTFTEAMQASPSIQTPGQQSHSLLRARRSRDDERPQSRSKTSLEARSPSAEGDSRPTSHEFTSTPATTFEQIAVANTLGRSDSHSSARSKSRPRTSSFDRVPVQSLSKEKLKDRGKARVGVVIGSLYLLAGQWTRALQTLVDNTTRLRALSDHIWHGKGLENIFTCLLLHVWADVDFQVPAICYQLSDKVRDRLSKAIVSELQQRIAAQQTPVEKLAASTPDLLKHILLLYRAVEGTIELPYLTIAEATVRMCKALTILHNGHGHFSHSIVDQAICGLSAAVPKETAPNHALTAVSVKTSRTAITDMLGRILPSGEEITVQEYISIHAGVASAYAMLGMQRKRILVLKSIVGRLVQSLDQARKLGAAEMGIHPTASLSLENGPAALLDAMHSNKGLSSIAREIVAGFGIQLGTSSGAVLTMTSGNDKLKADMLKELLRLCEAAPDLHGISQLVAACMMLTVTSSSPGSQTRNATSLSADQQTRYVGMMNRAQWLASQLHLPVQKAQYWDASLLTAISFAPVDKRKALIQRNTSKPAAANGQSTANPLLYDPNAPKAQTTAQAQVLVSGEPVTCSITLRNTADTAIDIEYLVLVSNDPGLARRLTNIKLGPACFRQISFGLVPSIVGSQVVNSCRVKVVGCEERLFALAGPPVPRQHAVKIKHLGQGPAEDSVELAPSASSSEVKLEIIEPQPFLVVAEDVEVTRTLMLIEGEHRQISLTLVNECTVPAKIVDITTSPGLSRVDNEAITIEPYGRAACTLDLCTARSLGSLSMLFSYQTLTSASDADYIRQCSLQYTVTVLPSLEIMSLNALNKGQSSVQLILDLNNRHTAALSVQRQQAISDKKEEDTAARVLHPAETFREHITIDRADTRFQTTTELVQYLRKRVRYTWSCQERSGELSLQELNLPEEVMATINGPAISVSLSLRGEEAVRPGSFFTLRAEVVNRTDNEIQPSRLSLSCQYRHTAASNLRRDIGIVGSTHRLLLTIPPHGRTTADFAICPLTAGRLDISTAIEPLLDSGKTHHTDTLSPALTVDVR